MTNKENCENEFVTKLVRNMNVNDENKDFRFIVPQEAPVFEPTSEEFKDPLKYIESIRHIAEKTGICKIKPPPEFEPPFSLNVDKFKFKPRVQKLNELEAKTRVKLDFFDLIGKFWELQGTGIKIPVLENKAVDLYTLHVLVNQEGGWEKVTSRRRWDCIARKMGYEELEDIGILLMHHYERLLYPYDIFRKEEALYRNRRRTKLNSPIENKKEGTKPKESRHRKRGRPRKCEYENENSEDDDDEDPLSKYVCRTCSNGDAEDYMLLCDGCDDSYHTFCLVPPLSEIPLGEWRCPLCIAEDLGKPPDAFGFDQAYRTYTLQQFGDMADQFKSDYFNMPVLEVPLSTVEQEFWRIVSSIEEDVTVEYGADLHAMDHGSGFPTPLCDPPLFPMDMVYADSKWNLNNLPVIEGSVLRYIRSDVSGMKIPWMYVGMCFSAFCWHNEDHWTYSINYLHWGEPKTWYGVAGSNAKRFEQCMKRVAPELFHTQPDLLQQLVTIMNPNMLMSDNVTVCRTDQQAGEFVLTFPKAYHAGFNQGYNFAEAVNFALPDWLKIGRACINEYSILNRFCVFSHDELVCNISLDWENLCPELILAVSEDMFEMVAEETALRDELIEWGTLCSKEEIFELLNDDERICDICKTTCFLSAVTCECDSRKLACLRHFRNLCNCPPKKHVLRYRYSIETLQQMLARVLTRKKSYEAWCSTVNTILHTSRNKRTVPELRSLIKEAQDNKFSSLEEFRSLQNVIKEAESYSDLAGKLGYNSLKKSKMLSSPVVERLDEKFGVDELKVFHEKIERLPCVIQEGRFVKELSEKVASFTAISCSLLKDDVPNSRELKHCIDAGNSIGIFLPTIVKLKELYDITQWLEDVKYRRDYPDQLTVEELRSLLSTGAMLPAHPAVEKTLGELQVLVTQVERWEEKVKLNLQAKYLIRITGIEGILQEAEDINAYLPSLRVMKDAYRRGKEWVAKVEAAKSGKTHPYMSVLEELVSSAREIPVRLDHLPQLELHLSSAVSWKTKTCRTFLRKNSQYTLMDALAPRDTFGAEAVKSKKRRRREEDEPKVVGGITLEGDVDHRDVVQAFKEAAKQEIVAMSLLRFRNKQKIKNDKGDKRYCLCRKVISGSMLQCVLCKDLFHAMCVPAPKTTGNKCGQYTGQQQVLQGRELKYICPCCQRSRRPRLETILPLNGALSKIPVRVPEGEALECLIERSMGWQDRARTALATPELTLALAKLSAISQRIVEAEAREKTQKIISCELQKVANQGHALALPSSEASSNAQQSQSSTHPFHIKLERNALHDIPIKLELGNTFPLYDPQSTSKSSHTSSGRESPLLVISEKTRNDLEEIMMEGDLLEVSLDETHHIWRILEATRPVKIDDSLTYRPYDPNFPEKRTGKEKTKFKRKSLEGFELQPKGKKIRVKVSQHKKLSNKTRDGDTKTDGEEASSDDDDSEGVYDEECAVSMCLKPTGAAVDWVQCDGGCEKWFHLICLGLRLEDVKQSDDYICKYCLRKEAE